MRNIRLQSGALQYIVLLSFLIFLLISSYIIYTYFSNKIISNSILQSQLRTNIQSAINLIESDANLINNSILNLYDDSLQNVQIEKKDWGVYTIVKLRAQRNKLKSEKIIVLGDNINKPQLPCLYMTDLYKYISLCGSTTLKGDCFVPKLGIRKSYIEGKGYSNNYLTLGKIKYSDKILPQLHTDLTTKIDNIYSENFKQDSVLKYESINTDSVYNSFAHRTLRIISDRAIYLTKTLKGNIIIESDSLIVVPSTITLDNCIIKANTIKIEDGFKGNFQAFAHDSICVGKNCILDLPTALLAKQFASKPCKIEIKTGTQLKGLAIVCSNTVKKQKLIIHKQTQVWGQYYCNGTTQLMGTIYGSIYTNNFYLYTSSALYENHLLDVIIDNSKLNANYPGLSLITKPQKLKLIRSLE